jgi:recombination protein RecT
MKTQQLTVKSLLSQESVKERFENILKDRAAGFMANLAVVVANNDMLAKCDPVSVISAAVISASIDLPIDPNLGFAAIVPYGRQAQFQIMYKGFIQLAIRSGQYLTINSAPVFEGELVKIDRVKGEFTFDYDKRTSDKVIGYTAYFKLINGFEKTLYMTVQEVNNHGKRFSKSYQKGFGIWVDDFDSMAQKTVLKRLLSKWGILSIEMKDAIMYDQAVFKNEETFTYADNPQSKSFDDTEDVEAIISKNDGTDN